MRYFPLRLNLLITLACHHRVLSRNYVSTHLYQIVVVSIWLFYKFSVYWGSDVFRQGGNLKKFFLTTRCFFFSENKDVVIPKYKRVLLQCVLILSHQMLSVLQHSTEAVVHRRTARYK